MRVRTFYVYIALIVESFQFSTTVPYYIFIILLESEGGLPGSTRHTGMVDNNPKQIEKLK